MGHDTTGCGSRDDVVLGKVRDSGVLTEKVLIEEEFTVDDRGGSLEDGEDGIGEDGCLAQVVGFVWVLGSELLSSCRFDGLTMISSVLLDIARVYAPQPARCS